MPAWQGTYRPVLHRISRGLPAWLRDMMILANLGEQTIDRIAATLQATRNWRDAIAIYSHLSDNFQLSL